MNWYKDLENEWKEVIETVASETKRSNTMIEKDIIQSMFLYELSKEEIPFVFKGGTSLSKAYKLIDRFSEDIDLSINRQITQSERKKTKGIITNIGKTLGMILTNENDIYSNHDYNKYIFEYKSLFNEVPSQIIVETSYYLTAFPSEKILIHNYITDFCDANNIKLSFEFLAGNFKIYVQSLERTLIDKVFAVCDYYLQDMQERDSRHLYDIAKLLTVIKFDKPLKSLIEKVRNDRLKLKNNPSAQPQYNITDLLNRLISDRFYESDYKNITSKLLYENVTYDKAIEMGIKIIADSKLF